MQFDFDIYIHSEIIAIIKLINILITSDSYHLCVCVCVCVCVSDQPSLEITSIQKSTIYYSQIVVG